MANYLPVVLDRAANQWLLRQRAGSIHNWDQLRQMLIDNFEPTCDQPGTKYALAQVRDYPNVLLRHYIQRFSDVWFTVTAVSAREAIDLFTQRLREDRSQDLRKELLRRPPRTMEELFQIAQEYARVDDALFENRPEPARYYRCDDDRDRDRDYRDDRRDNRRDDSRDDRRDGRRDDRGADQHDNGR